MIKTLLKTTLLAILLITVSCSKDDAQEEAPQNQIPTIPQLISPASEGTNVDVTPTFSWEAATDADGDTITYDIYADTSANPTTLIGTTNETNFELTERLSLLETYKWKVIAKDGNGGESESTEQSFNTRNIQFSNATQNASFSKRYEFGSTLFQNKVWLSGGNRDNDAGEVQKSNDVWFSENGVDWTLATSNAQWLARRAHTMTSFEDKLWIIGGEYESENGEVWNSDDGINWNLVTDSPGFGKIRHHTTTVFNDKLYVIHNNKVWFSSDGIIWTLASDGVVGSSRRRHTALSFNNKLWIIGASGFSDPVVMSSSDGISWAVENNLEDNFEIDSHTSVVFDGKMWVIAGFSPPSLNEVWFSGDGITWTLASENSAFAGRIFPQSQVLNNKIWLFGGTTVNPNNNTIDGTANLNDVWFID